MAALSSWWMVGWVFGAVVVALLAVLLLTITALARKTDGVAKDLPGADQLSTTRRLAESVPPLALAYLDKLALGPRPAASPPPEPVAAAPAAAAAAPSSSGADSHSDSSLPAWKLFSR